MPQLLRKLLMGAFLAALAGCLLLVSSSALASTHTPEYQQEHHVFFTDCPAGAALVESGPGSMIIPIGAGGRVAVAWRTVEGCQTETRVVSLGWRGTLITDGHNPPSITCQPYSQSDAVDDWIKELMDHYRKLAKMAE